MARPKTGKPPKKNLTLTVDEKTRAELSFISEHYGESISYLISKYAENEARNIREQKNDEAPVHIK